MKFKLQAFDICYEINFKAQILFYFPISMSPYSVTVSNESKTSRHILFPASLLSAMSYSNIGISFSHIVMKVLLFLLQSNTSSRLNSITH